MSAGQPPLAATQDKPMQFLIGGLIAKGGFGFVCHLFGPDNKPTTPPLCIKQIDLSRYDEKTKQEAFKRFETEIKAMQTLATCDAPGHDQIVPIEAADADKGWYIMPFYPRGSLGSWIKDAEQKQIRLEEEHALQLIYQILIPLRLAHSRNILHRDLTPNNIFLGPKKIMLGDFGLAKVPDVTSITEGYMGTPGFMAPEVTYHCQWSAASDIFSLGMILHRVLPNPSAKGLALIKEMTAVDVNKRIQSCDKVIERICELYAPVAPVAAPTATAASPVSTAAAAPKASTADHNPHQPMPSGHAVELAKANPDPIAILGGVVAIALVAIGAYVIVRELRKNKE